MRTLSTLLVLSLAIMAGTPPTEKEFLKNLNKFCGKSFAGKAVFPEGDKDPFKGQALKIHFAKCTDTEVRIPFQVGEDKSRTWVLTLDENGLLLKHDHRHEDGTPDEITMYGGYARQGGRAFEQSFPADAHTANLIPAASTNEWSLVLNPDKKILSYILKRDGQLRFHADFDLSKSLEK
ncbi:MAG: hypothetical protein JNK44_04230 [Cyclobacteriaceae bacterium]|nr:hypothetical protein [Cyclobacteriaceae bacterium]